MEYIKISIATEFSKTPGPRFIREGDFSGEKFFKEILEPRYLEAKEVGKGLEIDLDCTAGYGTSFLEEVFGGLARKYPEEEVMKNLIFISNDEPYLRDDITDYIKHAKNK